MESTYGCDEKYQCTTALYLFSILYHGYNISIDWDIGAPDHVKYVVYGLNNIEKLFINIVDHQNNTW